MYCYKFLDSIIYFLSSVEILNFLARLEEGFGVDVEAIISFVGK